MEIRGLAGNKGISFLEDFAVAKEQRHLLATGAALIYAYSFYDWTPQTLRIYPLVMTPERVLEEQWFVHSREEAERLIEGVLTIGGLGWVGEPVSESRAVIDERLGKYASGDKSALSEPESAMLEDVLDTMVGYKWEKRRVTQGDLDQVTTTLAWDIDRAAFIARVAYNCGYFSEKETWAILERTLKTAQQAVFPDWLSYAISLMKGAAIGKSDSDFAFISTMWDNICYLPDPKWGEIWSWNPLK